MANILSQENSSFEAGTTGSWTPMTNAQILNISGVGYDGTHAIQYWPTVSGQVQIDSGKTGVLPGNYYSYSVWVLPGTPNTRSIAMYVEYYDNTNTYVSSSNQVSASERSGQWVELLLIDLSPVNAYYARIVIGIASAGASEVHYMDFADIELGQKQPSSGAGAGTTAQQTFQISTGGIMIDLSPGNTWNNGIALSKKDLGGPAVREITYDHSQMNGADDLTKFFSQRVVDIVGTCFPVGAQSRNVAWERLAPFLDPALRCTITYAIDTDIGLRSITNARLSSVTRTQNSPITYDFEIQFAADPIVQSAETLTADIAPSSGLQGRTYPRIYGLMYPSVHGTINVWSSGLLNAWPIYTIYGPCNNPTIALTDANGNPLWQISLDMTIAGGHTVVINTRSRTIVMDGTTDVYHTIDLNQSSWGPIRPGNNYLKYTGSSLSTPSHCSVAWNDSFLY